MLLAESKLCEVDWGAQSTELTSARAAETRVLHLTFALSALSGATRALPAKLRRDAV